MPCCCSSSAAVRLPCTSEFLYAQAHTAMSALKNKPCQLLHALHSAQRDKVKHLRASGKHSDHGGSLAGTFTALSIGHAKGAGRVLMCVMGVD